MSNTPKKLLSAALVLCLILSVSICSVHAAVPSAPIITTPTGYTQADHVQYSISGGTVANWGARGELCTFTTTYANAYYTGSYTFDSLAANAGGTSQSSAPQSALYKALQDMMKAKHHHETSYGETRDYYKFTDCVGNETSKLSTFYTGKLVNSGWDKGKTYTREHTWPNSKGLNGNDENDIMMLRPENSSDNSSRGNKAYGISSGCFDPGVSVRGDCARIFLYVYVRWGNTGNAWGTGGVIENLDVLLQWMEEDPVDTWEMGRNDAVQSITGVRNVFVDYPEFAWLLFGREVPASVSTPSKNQGTVPPSPPTTTPTEPSAAVCTHTHTEIRGAVLASCTEAGYSGDTYCVSCGKKLASGNPEPKQDHVPVTGKPVEATCTQPGKEADVICSVCKTVLTPGNSIPKKDHVPITGKPVEPTCVQPGKEADVTCSICKEVLTPGAEIPATGAHNYGDWVITKEPSATENGEKSRTCAVCDKVETEMVPASGTTPTESTPAESTPAQTESPATTPAESTPAKAEPSDSTAIVMIVVAVSVAAVVGIGAAAIAIKKKKQS